MRYLTSLDETAIDAMQTEFDTKVEQLLDNLSDEQLGNSVREMKTGLDDARNCVRARKAADQAIALSENGAQYVLRHRLLDDSGYVIAGPHKNIHSSQLQQLVEQGVLPIQPPFDADMGLQTEVDAKQYIMDLSLIHI